ncbi:hypothetical protein [uncultured Paraglaciecola sp.]|uniref:hypothetical protein n=1 Tax=uncultured Paraglaciecola sp. TaxID=1765024 RepID=UPI00260C06C4|nr:hypothetical protein [uncultured Paraglaciecola sp.]
MGVHRHASGKYRAYKKIRGREHQFYFATAEEAYDKQAHLDSMARLVSRPAFSRCGRLKGFRVKRDARRGSIMMRVQLMVEGRRVDTSIAYHGEYAPLWREAYEQWKTLHQLTPADLADYLSKTQAARRLYMNDIREAERLC